MDNLLTKQSEEFNFLASPDRAGIFIGLCGTIDKLMRRRKRVIVAIDGDCASGKTSLARLLGSTYSCNVFQMDDFFLRPAQRTPERLAEPGGNIDYERFREEVLKPLKSGKPFAYRPYDCHTGELSEPVAVDPTPLNVIEGAYSMHPHFGRAYDYRVFMRVHVIDQRCRLLKRNEDLFDRYLDEWIPMEHKYFDHFKIPEKCNEVMILH